MTRIESPASTTTNTPAAATSNAVPRSGCTPISMVGTMISAPMTRRSINFGGNWRLCKNQAAAIGTMSFMISDGWKRMPRSSQRRAP